MTKDRFKKDGLKKDVFSRGMFSEKGSFKEIFSKEGLLKPDSKGQGDIPALKKRLWILLFGMLVLLSSILTGLTFWQDYTGMKDEVRQVLEQSASNLTDSRYGFSPSAGADERIERYTIASELPLYSIYLRGGNAGTVVYQNADQDQIPDAINEASRILSSYSRENLNTGNLFAGGYAWYFSSPGLLSLLDISPLTGQLYKSLFMLLLLWALFILLAALICQRVVKWLIEPVEISVQKQKEFIQDASHELKTPLAVILASAEVMEKDPSPKWIENIKEEAGRMNALIASMLDLAKLESDAIELQPENLSYIASRECLMQEAVLFEKQIELEEEITEDLMVEGQKESLAQLVSILLDNAGHHAKSRIKVSLQTEGKDILLQVANDGESIPPEMIGKIFERFSRQDASRTRSEGRYGLGLAIAQKIVSLHHGQIEVHSNPLWTTFEVRLPKTEQINTDQTNTKLPTTE